MLNAFADSPILLCLAAMAASALSGLLPVSPAEPILIGIAALLPGWMLLPLAALVTLSVMSTKVLIYLSGSGAQRVIPARFRPRVDALAARLNSRGPKARRTIILLSAATGMPSFYVVTLLCGTLRLSLREWFIAGTIGRAIRITCLVFLPRLFASAF